jgi:uncharacterized protein
MSRYEWDAEKDRKNLAKHGVSLEDGASVDLDPLKVIRPDPFHDPVDERFLMIGYSNSGVLLIVITSERGRRPRVISARRATKRERYEFEARP